MGAPRLPQRIQSWESVARLESRIGMRRTLAPSRSVFSPANGRIGAQVSRSTREIVAWEIPERAASSLTVSLRRERSSFKCLPKTAMEVSRMTRPVPRGSSGSPAVSILARPEVGPARTEISIRLFAVSDRRCRARTSHSRIGGHQDGRTGQASRGIRVLAEK